MNEDTSSTVSIHLMEQGIRTLTHDWRNVLNGINLRLISAQVAEETKVCNFDLSEIQQLIASATSYLNGLSRKLSAPNLEMMAYPNEYFLEDLADYLQKKTEFDSTKIKWEKSSIQGKTLVDFIAISQTVSELIENTLRYLSVENEISIFSRTENGFLVIGWSENIVGTPLIKDWGMKPFLTTEQGRLGLGLYYARRILEAHRGYLRFDFAEDSHTLTTNLLLPLEVV